ncbi:hypothetical protein Bbelb_140870 [Branchiostoma belcheri]|nr:hypothetical protein Bbelb_140870 [Branchiostoma belcheri]
MMAGSVALIYIYTGLQTRRDPARDAPGSSLDPARDLTATRTNCKSQSEPYRKPHGSRRETDRTPDGSLTETGRQGDQNRRTLGVMTPAGVYTEDMPNGRRFKYLVTIYTSFVRPVLEYCAPVWHPGLTCAQSDKLEAVQRRAVRTILGMRFTSYEQGRTDLNLPLLSDRRQKLCLKFGTHLESHTPSMLPPKGSDYHDRTTRNRDNGRPGNTSCGNTGRDTISGKEFGRVLHVEARGNQGVRMREPAAEEMEGAEDEQKTLSGKVVEIKNIS